MPRRSVLRCLALGALAPAAAACGEEGAPESLGFADIGDHAPAAWLLGLWQVEDAHGGRRLLYVLPQGTWRIQADGTETDSGRWRLQDGQLTWTVDGGRPGAVEGVPDTVGAALSKDYRLSGGPAGGYGSVRVRYGKGRVLLAFSGDGGGRSPGPTVSFTWLDDGTKCGNGCDSPERRMHLRGPG
ncbi:hypothetical protein AB0F11_33620 [Streptomyces sp. NPDC032472]|uniref:hypothetical protein n=1 Tax=Streptomyces sp. NPDC032472 TaxID=3155018 RepID=UPI0033EE80F2